MTERRPNQTTGRPANPVSDVVLRFKAVRRARNVAIGVAFGYVGLAMVGANLMLVDNERLQARAKRQFQQPVVLEAKRGDLLDRQGEVLATSVDMPELHADPSLLTPEAIAPLAAKLSPLINVDEDVLVRKLSRNTRRDVLLTRELHPGVAEKARRFAPSNTLWTTATSRRYYPGKHLASALIGTVGRNARGTSGLERSFDRQLRGDTFRFVQLRDRKGRNIGQTAATMTSAHEGDQIRTTIDRRIQVAAEEALDAVLERSAPESANLVVMEVATGAILAVANRPSMNPNDRRALDMKLLKNHASVDAVEPGSVFKPLVVALALDEGIVTANQNMDCEGGRWRVGRKTIRDDHPHDVISLGEVIKYSSNIGTAKLALQLGAAKLIAGFEDFGIGRSIGLGIPGEVAGLLRSADTIRPIELATTSYGQGVTTTTVHLASAIAAIANGGVRMTPYMVEEIRDASGDLVARHSPRAEGRVVSQEAAEAVTKMMVTVTEEGGTGTRARVSGHAVAGKTGTAWKVVDRVYSPTARIASFVGFLPADDPKVAIAVVVDTPTKGSRYGGLAAGPAFADVGHAAMRYLGVPPDPDLLEDEDTQLARRAAVSGTPTTAFRFDHPPALRWNASAELVLPDLFGRSLRDVLVTFEGAGLALNLVGQGRVISQSPPPGHALSVGDTVEVLLR